MPTEMKDKEKDGKDRINEMKNEQQQKMEEKDVKEPGGYPEAEGDTGKDVPPGT